MFTPTHDPPLHLARQRRRLRRAGETPRRHARTSSNLFICGTDQGFVGIVGAIISGIPVANRHLLGDDLKSKSDAMPCRKTFLQTRQDRQYDVIVIGSGLAGLTAANMLARAGHRVLLLEQHYKLGGLATWFRRPGGHIFDISLHGFPSA